MLRHQTSCFAHLLHVKKNFRRLSNESFSLKGDCDKNQCTSGYSDQCRVCVPLKVSPETNNFRVRRAIQSRYAMQSREMKSINIF